VRQVYYCLSFTPAPAAELIEYAIGGGLERNADYALVFGRILDPQVVAVEATFDDKQTLRGEPAEKNFAIVAPGAGAVCELRVLGSDDQLFKQIVPDFLPAQCAP
jgi:hypothetical protein